MHRLLASEPFEAAGLHPGWSSNSRRLIHERLPPRCSGGHLKFSREVHCTKKCCTQSTVVGDHVLTQGKDTITTEPTKTLAVVSSKCSGGIFSRTLDRRAAMRAATRRHSGKGRAVPERCPSISVLSHSTRFTDAFASDMRLQPGDGPSLPDRIMHAPCSPCRTRVAMGRPRTFRNSVRSAQGEFSPVPVRMACLHALSVAGAKPDDPLPQIHHHGHWRAQRADWYEALDRLIASGSCRWRRWPTPSSARPRPRSWIRSSPAST